MNPAISTSAPSQAALVEFGHRLRAARLACGLAQIDVAQRLRLSNGYISRLEGGKARPTVATVCRLAEVCRTDAESLLILAGRLPDDIQKILARHPVAAPALLRDAFPHAKKEAATAAEPAAHYDSGRSGGDAPYEIFREDCFAWMEHREPSTIHAIVTDPPYGLKEYTSGEKAKLRRGRGGVWRMPPALDGCVRRPLPRFTVLSEGDKRRLSRFFRQWGRRAFRVLVPGGHVFLAANPLLSHLVYASLVDCGFEKRGEVIRLVQTLRGGDRPKNAHEEFSDVTVMPRSCWEPWGLFRKPCEGRVQDNLRKWRTGGLRRIDSSRPFFDVIRSAPTRSSERSIAPHPSLKPQAFMRQIVRASLPLLEGVVLDPFMGGGSTVAAAINVGYASIGVESDPEFMEIARAAIPQLAALPVKGGILHRRRNRVAAADSAHADLFG